MTPKTWTGYRAGAICVALATLAVLPWIGGAHAAFPGPNGQIVIMSDRSGNADI